jgi:ParB-like chromosome segregation protein Spo0J
MSKFESKQDALKHQKALIEKLQNGTRRQRRLAKKLATCRPGHRCGREECPLCQQRKKKRPIVDTTRVTNSRPQTIKRIAIDGVLVPDNRRECNKEKVKQLAASMRDIGLRTPITVRKGQDGPILVTGLHRMQAALSLGWKEIDAAFMRGGKLDAKLWEIAENLHRAELTPMQRAELINKWLKLIARKQPASAPGELKSQGGRPKGGIAKAARELPVSGKTPEARRKSVERAVKVDGISPNAKAAAKKAGLDTNQGALLEIAHERNEKAQIAKVAEIAKRKKVGPVAIGNKELIILKQNGDQARRLGRSWETAHPIIRRLFSLIFVRRRSDYKHLKKYFKR